MEIKTNHHERLVIEDYELTLDEQKEFDYLNWEAIKRGEASASFMRYKGQLYDLGEFMTTSTLPEFSPLRKWHGYLSDSHFSGIVVRFVDGMDYVIVGTFLA